MAVNKDQLLLQQVELTKKVIDRMDTIIDHMKKDLNIYDRPQPQEWVGTFNIPDSLDENFQRVFNFKLVEDSEMDIDSAIMLLRAQDAIIRELQKEVKETDDELLKFVGKNSDLRKENKSVKGMLENTKEEFNQLKQKHEELLQRRDNVKCDHVAYQQQIAYLKVKLEQTEKQLKTEVELRNKNWNKEG